MSLSDKLIFGGLMNGTGDDDHCVVQRQHLKESIKELKEKLCECKFLGQGIKCSRCRIINKVFGVRLTGDSSNKIM